MSSEVPLPRTAVPFGIADPVEQARTELKAALAAIEDKANVPRRVGRATDRVKAQARAHPVTAGAIVVAGAAVVGVVVWRIILSYTR